MARRHLDPAAAALAAESVSLRAEMMPECSAVKRHKGNQRYCHLFRPCKTPLYGRRGGGS
ncbi:hypothetical protein IF1G_10003 [Cordyceps javanica]|uniref:Uncharacterized protein n=1 Tax=Cordyceps javanica TaxID=43265 RepID=A0A545UPV4_9HYPO|nr:hypothetical protein IF1G_10003 [Cordyceps javanica]